MNMFSQGRMPAANPFWRRARLAQAMQQADFAVQPSLSPIDAPVVSPFAPAVSPFPTVVPAGYPAYNYPVDVAAPAPVYTAPANGGYGMGTYLLGAAVLAGVVGLIAYATRK